MAGDPLDGDVRRLRYGSRGGSNGDPVGYSAVRSEMNDEAFTLTPLDVRKQEFRKSLRGYDKLGVEDFRMRVADALERAIRERQVLEERVSALTEQLRVFREREKAMNEALVAAQQLRQDTRAAAEREAPRTRCRRRWRKQSGSFSSIWAVSGRCWSDSSPSCARWMEGARKLERSLRGRRGPRRQDADRNRSGRRRHPRYRSRRARQRAACRRVDSLSRRAGLCDLHRRDACGPPAAGDARRQASLVGHR